MPRKKIDRPCVVCDESFTPKTKRSKICENKDCFRTHTNKLAIVPEYRKKHGLPGSGRSPHVWGECLVCGIRYEGAIFTLHCRSKECEQIHKMNIGKDPTYAQHAREQRASRRQPREDEKEPQDLGGPEKGEDVTIEIKMTITIKGLN